MTQSLLHTIVTGPETAPILLLLNSLGATHAMWDVQMPLLEQRYRVIRYDARGHGLSAAPSGPYSFEDLVADAIGVLDAYEVRKTSVMGISLGGMTALGLGLAAPDRVERLVCCAARADAPPPFVQSWHDRLAILASAGIEGVWDATAKFWLSDETRTSNPASEAALREQFLTTSEQGYRGCAAALMRLDYLRHMGDLTVPTLFVSGEHDAGASPTTMRAMADACQRGSHAVVQGAKHIINVDRPTAFELSTAAFLKA